MKNYLRDLLKKPKSVNDSASQSDSTRVSVSSAFGAHDHNPVPGKGAGSAESTASSKYWLHLSVIDDDLAPLLQMVLLP